MPTFSMATPLNAAAATQDFLADESDMPMFDLGLDDNDAPLNSAACDVRSKPGHGEAGGAEGVAAGPGPEVAGGNAPPKGGAPQGLEDFSQEEQPARNPAPWRRRASAVAEEEANPRARRRQVLEDSSDDDDLEIMPQRPASTQKKTGVRGHGSQPVRRRGGIAPPAPPRTHGLVP